MRSKSCLRRSFAGARFSLGTARSLGLRMRIGSYGLTPLLDWGRDNTTMAELREVTKDSYGNRRFIDPHGYLATACRSCENIFSDWQCTLAYTIHGEAVCEDCIEQAPVKQEGPARPVGFSPPEAALWDALRFLKTATIQEIASQAGVTLKVASPLLSAMAARRQVSCVKGRWKIA